MAKSIFARVSRLLSATVEDAVDRMEQAGGDTVMREAIREADRAIDQVKAELEATMARRLQAARQQKMLTERCEELTTKAKFAVSERRDDLAEAALSRQVDFEAQAKKLDAVQQQAREEEQRLEAGLTALNARKRQMEDALEAYLISRREAASGGDGPTRPSRSAEKKVDEAEAGVRSRHGRSWRSGLRPRRRGHDQPRCRDRWDAEERHCRRAAGRAESPAGRLMIRKPPADWNRADEGAAVRTVRTAAAVAKGSAEVARRGRQAVAGLVCFVFAAIWAPLAIVGGLARRAAKLRWHRGDGSLCGLVRLPGLCESVRDVGLTDGQAPAHRRTGSFPIVPRVGLVPQALRSEPALCSPSCSRIARISAVGAIHKVRYVSKNPSHVVSRPGDHCP